MKKSDAVARIVGFLLSTIIGAGVFGAFAAWAVSTFDPAVQEVIGLANSPWLIPPEDPNFIRVGSGTADGCRNEPVAVSAAAAGRR